MTPTRMVVIAAALLSSASLLVFGVWAYLTPRSFADYINFSPYNQHLTHDAGAFQIGLGVAVLLAVFSADSMVVALSGFVAASALHTLSHYTDRDIGGHSSDVSLLSLVTVIALAGLVVHLYDRRRRGQGRRGLPNPDRQGRSNTKN